MIGMDASPRQLFPRKEAAALLNRAISHLLPRARSTSLS